MRTTITLEPDVEALIRTAMKERGISFKEALNSAIRSGLTQPRQKRRPYVQKTFSLGAEQSFRWDKALDAAAAIEDEEIARKTLTAKMILVDVNLLIYAVNGDAPLHKKAKSWLEAAISGTETVALSWIVLLAFLRIMTRPGLFQKTLSVESAFDLVESWLAQPAVIVVEPTGRHARVLRDLLLPLGTGGNLTSDAHLAALAIEHGAELYSADNDFSRFAGLRWRNPIRLTNLI